MRKDPNKMINTKVNEIMKMKNCLLIKKKQEKPEKTLL